MEASGIVRRIDELGRIVIPKEIRKQLRIREGEEMEISTEDGFIHLRKYSPMDRLNDCARQYADALAQSTGQIACITDRDKVIAVSGMRRKEMEGRAISKEWDDAVNGRLTIVAKQGEKKYVNLSEEDSFSSQIICPIIANGDALGAVAVFGKDNRMALGEGDLKLAKCAAIFLANQIN
ncbi:MAG: AbrB/MazE/SpoVT family DNA-binding domain-containing protein [Lachnospiraceae bacterium]|nr:AbrB/MazE/SpoVT family DNA-binding domain-containing protein [Lachnospiraceae bacterium]